MKTDHSFSDFQSGIGAAALVTLDREQLIYHTRTALVDRIAYLHLSDKNVIPVSEVFELPKFMTFWTMLCLTG